MKLRLGKKTKVALFVALASLVVWFFVGLRDRATLELLRPPVDIKTLSVAKLERRMDADTKALRSLVISLENLQGRMYQVRTEFQSGQRKVHRPEDDELIRSMLLSYLTARTAMFRVLNYYQEFDQLADPAHRG